MKKIISISCLIIISIFLFTSCSKDGIKDKDNGMLTVKFNTPSTTPNSAVRPPGVYTLKGTTFNYELSNIATGGIISSGVANFEETKNFEITPANYKLIAYYTYNSTFAGTTIDFIDNDKKDILIEKGKVSTITIY